MKACESGELLSRYSFSYGNPIRFIRFHNVKPRTLDQWDALRDKFIDDLCTVGPREIKVLIGIGVFNECVERYPLVAVRVMAELRSIYDDRHVQSFSDAVRRITVINNYLVKIGVRFTGAFGMVEKHRLKFWLKREER